MSIIVCVLLFFLDGEANCIEGNLLLVLVMTEVMIIAVTDETRDDFDVRSKSFPL